MVKNKILGIIFILLTLSSCATPAYQLPPSSWYASQNYDQLTYWIQYWEQVLQDENRKCAYNFPHNHEYHRYVSRHLNALYLFRGHMEMRLKTCNYY